MVGPGTQASPPVAAGRVLIAGVGNVFLTDDGFGSQVARQLAAMNLPDGVTVTDYGIRAMHLAYDLLDEWDRLILIDLIPARGEPGSVHVLSIAGPPADDGAPDPHGMAPLLVLATVSRLGGVLPPTTLVGCEPADVSDGFGLSDVVSAAVGPAVAAVVRLLAGAAAPVAAAIAVDTSAGGR